MSGGTALVNRPVITAWSAVSPFGIGRAAFTEGIRERRPAAAGLDDERWQAAGDRACLVPDFDLRTVLGKKGVRSMDRVTGLAVTTVARLLDDAPRNRWVATGEDAALVLGTTTGSVQSQMDFTRDSLTGEKPYLVDPARFPNAVMNCAAGQSAIWHQLKGPNTTIAGGHAAGLYALNYARRLLTFGRARTVLCGAVEEFSHARSWLERHAHRPGTEGPAQLPGEGCGLLLVEQRGPGARDDAEQPVLAEILAVEMGIALDGGVRPALASCLRRALDRAGVRPEEIWAVSTSEAPGPSGEQERAAVAEAAEGADPVHLTQAALIGDTGAAAAAFQIAGVLVHAETTPEAAGRVALVTSVDRDGAVGCALLRLAGPR
ncbi:beta-ketoacyl synthase N-terminal-like domain-containing protein [Streptomyces rapamycinicus]|uniref:3-oxoacyl-ACP synthase n=2 Tax=Streptomyces rapamycinicus TaxID=1226757 RepID=A0A3L8RK74_STRRN|nr:beta-ketoacyl synthase N-terminal-like domain-containing protein [Streptomyces rapamycinicus]MBB4784620.1 3-oxoacyl-[acyl-carrier-protein] synthase II [Streptomyces rapamycinicus]RLV79898.1 3-oxoacyl-ACP synthase [Streptomyces rapamycinicus NRRL 5491]UTO64907.1 3-oxoacyl-ACP synthase [Streptomyces rapamycinicus]UTP32862.1 3-oxoacyl-ACP synthase [Streptomyces rapamycinicus NRRL 5491]